MKRLLTLALVSVLALSLAACARRTGDDDANFGASVQPETQQSQSISEQESIERKLIKVISDNYAETEVAQISVTDNGKTEETGDFAVQALLTWNVKNDAEQTLRSLKTYSEDLSNRVSKDMANVSALTVSWTVPSLDRETASVIYGYERKGGALQETERELSDKLRKAEKASEERETAAASSQPAASDDAVARSAPAEDGAGDQTAQTAQDQEEALSAILSVMEESLKKSYGSSYTLTHDDATVQIGVWKDGVAEGAVSAQSGDQARLSGWRTLVSAVQDMSSTLADTLHSAGIENRQVIMSVINDQNRDNVLLVVTDGKITYNWVEPDTQQAE